MSSPEETSPRVASIASRILRNPLSGPAALSVAGSALTQAADHAERACAICRDLTRPETDQLVSLLSRCTDPFIVALRHAVVNHLARTDALRIARLYATGSRRPSLLDGLSGS